MNTLVNVYNQRRQSGLRFGVVNPVA